MLATPLIVTGSVGQVSLKLGTKLMADAVAEPLEITDKTITVAPSPKQMMKAVITEEL